MKFQDKLSKKPQLPTGGLRLADVDTNEGPQPMRSYKPGAKNTNAADKFWSDHQGEHENRAATPARGDLQEYNKVPRLDEPLTKMAALSKIKASATVVDNQSAAVHTHRRKSTFICPHCAKKLMERKGHHKTFKSHKRHSRSRNVELRSRVTKSNSRQKTFFKASISKSGCNLVQSKKCRCRYCMRAANKGTCTNIVLKEASTITGFVFEKRDGRVTADTDCSNTPNGSAKSGYTNSRISDASSMHSGSYKSNISHMSLDHEPMVTNEE